MSTGEKTARATKLQVAENDLKRLMADVSRAMEKAQEAVARITGKAAGDTANTQPRQLVELATHA